jgi:hypothetical protein
VTSPMSSQKAFVSPAQVSWTKSEAMLPIIGPAIPTHVELECKLHLPVASAPANIKFPIEWVTTIVSAIALSVLVLLTASARSQTISCSVCWSTCCSPC